MGEGVIAPLRYAVLYHGEIAEPHFDLMVETYPGSDLATWRSPVWPIESLVTLQRLRDHRKIFLDYEGDLSGHRGRVERVGGGKCSVVIDEDSVWKIRLLDSGIELRLRKIENDQWVVEALS